MQSRVPSLLICVAAPSPPFRADSPRPPSVLRGAGGGESAALKQEVADGEGNRQAFLSLHLTLTKFSKTKMLHSLSSLSELWKSVVKRQRDSKDRQSR